MREAPAGRGLQEALRERAPRGSGLRSRRRRSRWGDGLHLRRPLAARPVGILRTVGAAGPFPFDRPGGVLRRPLLLSGSRRRCRLSGSRRRRGRTGLAWQGPGQGPGAAGVLPAAARVPERQDAADLRVLPPGAEPARREPAVPDETVWPGRHRRAQAALGARPAGRARGGGVEGRRPDPARPGLRHAADGDRVPRRRRGRPDPVRPVGVRRLDGRRALHPAPGVSARRAAAPRRLPVRPGPGRAALRAPMGGPRHAPAAASGGGRYSQETGWKAS